MFGTGPWFTWLVKENMPKIITVVPFEYSGHSDLIRSSTNSYSSSEFVVRGLA